jgi:hypothetical protein
MNKEKLDNTLNGDKYDSAPTPIEVKTVKFFQYFFHILSCNTNTRVGLISAKLYHQLSQICKLFIQYIRRES